MATTKKTSSKSVGKLSQKAKKMVQGDFIKSIAIVSVLLNILFLVTVLVLSNRSTFDRRLYVGARDRYCQNTNALKERATELLDQKAAARERQIDCIGADFKPFYNEAIEKYQAASQQ